jgi:hypothetical protein
MRAFAKHFRPEKQMLVGTSGLPVEEFLSMDPEKLF